MFTPQEIQEKTFPKAMFGGYDMQTVDEFLEPLTEDYIAIYNENAVLKGKMKVLVAKLEEYREQETSMKKALLSAQRTADEIVQNAKKKADGILADAGEQQKMQALSQELSAEQERVEDAKKVAQNFIAVIEKAIGRHLDLLGELKTMDLTVEQKPEPAQPAPAEPTRNVRTVADEIERNLEKTVGAPDPQGATRVMKPLRDPKFADLQFGSNYTQNS